MSDYASATAIDYSVDSAAGIFEPDVVLPDQYFDAGLGGLLGGERKLMAALLSDGIEAFLAHANPEHADFEKSEAFDWVMTKDLSYVFSFDSVCHCLGIDPDYLRLGLSRYVQSVRAASNSAAPQRVWKKIRRPRK